MMVPSYRVGQIVPSSNTTMETEIPAILQSRQTIAPERFTFHSSRMRMRRVTKEELVAMDAESERCATELSDAKMDVIGYACLVAIMSAGAGYHRIAEQRLNQRTAEIGAEAPIVSSAGALIEGLQALGARKIAMITPYMKPLTKLVVDYVESEGVEVLDCISLEIPDNLEVGLRDPLDLPDIVRRLNTANAEAIVLSACVQMRSLPAIPIVQSKVDVPVVSAAVCTAYRMLTTLQLAPVAPMAGALLQPI
jgi:maleate isomerase